MDDEVERKTLGAGQDTAEPLHIAPQLDCLPQTRGGDCEVAPMVTYEHEVEPIAWIRTSRERPVVSRSRDVVSKKDVYQKLVRQFVHGNSRTAVD